MNDCTTGVIRTTDHQRERRNGKCRSSGGEEVAIEFGDGSRRGRDMTNRESRRGWKGTKRASAADASREGRCGCNHLRKRKEEDLDRTLRMETEEGSNNLR